MRATLIAFGLTICIALPAGAAVVRLIHTYGAQYTSVASSLCGSGEACIYKDTADSKLKTDVGDWQMEIGPGISQGFNPAGGFSMPNATWRWESGGTGAWSSQGDFFRMDPGTTGSAPWNMGAIAADNAGNTAKDVVMTYGWNCGSSGPIDSTKGAFCQTYENDFGPSGGDQMEYYINYTAPNAGTSYRFLTVNSSLVSPFAANVGLVGSTVGIGVGNTIGDATRLTLTSTGSTLNGPSNAGSVSIDSSQGEFSYSSGDNLSRVTMLPGEVRLRGAIGNIGSEATGYRFIWDTVKAKLQSPDTTAYFQANNTDLRMIAAGVTGMIFSGGTLTLDSSQDFFVKRNGTRQFRFGITGADWKLLGADDNAFLGLLSGGFVGLTDVGETVQIASGAGILFKTNGVYRARFDYSSFRPDSDGTFDLGQAAQRWATGYVGSSGSLPTCDSTTRGGYRTVFAGSGSSDTFQVCMKAAADSYAWRTVFSAP
jgi:hypothetical protein